GPHPVALRGGAAHRDPRHRRGDDRPVREVPGPDQARRRTDPGTHVVREGRRSPVRGAPPGARPHDRRFGAGGRGRHGHHRRVRPRHPAAAAPDPRGAGLPPRVPTRGPDVIGAAGSDELIAIPDPVDRDDLRTLLRALLRLDEATVVRLTDGGDGRMRAWARTPFGALVVRGLGGTCPGGDVVSGADHLLTELDVLARGDLQGRIDPGMPLTSSWQGLLPLTDRFDAVEVVPAQQLLDLTEAGRETARAHAGPAGLPPSLLDQETPTVGADGEAPAGPPPALLCQAPLPVGADGDGPVGVDLRTVFSVVMCGVIPERGGRAPEGEPVQVSTRGSWIRLDARYGTAFRHVDSLTLDPVR